MPLFDPQWGNLIISNWSCMFCRASSHKELNLLWSILYPFKHRKQTGNTQNTRGKKKKSKGEDVHNPETHEAITGGDNRNEPST